MSASCDVIVIFSIYDQFGAIRKPDSGRIAYKTYIFINSNLLSYKKWKQTWKISYTALTLLLWVLFPKNAFFCKKDADISKIKKTLVRKGIELSETACVCQLMSTYIPNFKFLA